MEQVLQDLHAGLNNAYILFSFLLGIYAAVIAGRNIPISGNFWGAMWMNTGLAALVFVVLLVLAILGENPKRFVYYLYALYFVISLPGLYAALGGEDNRRSALWFSAVSLFNAGAAYRSVTVLIEPWE
ncbi:MAG: hypothetical protein GYB66_06240 [Chloroflexi bacterium]|nr:hypothetical protein [Chloroflexota bacterium]